MGVMSQPLDELELKSAVAEARQSSQNVLTEQDSIRSQEDTRSGPGLFLDA